MVEALATKNKEIEALVSSLDSLKKQAALSEGNLASLQVLYSFVQSTLHHFVLWISLHSTINCSSDLRFSIWLSVMLHHSFSSGKHGVYNEK